MEHSYFETFIMACIFLNMIALAMTYYDMSDSFAYALDVVNLIFVVIFAVEMVSRPWSRIPVYSFCCLLVMGDADMETL